MNDMNTLDREIIRTVLHSLEDSDSEENYMAFFESDSDVSEDEDDSEDDILMEERRVPRNENYFETIVMYDDAHFVEHFRLSRFVTARIAAEFEYSPTKRNCPHISQARINFVTTKVWPCTEKTSNDIVFRSTKLYRVNREQFVDAYIESKISFDDKLQLLVKCSYWVNGGFKPRLSMPLGGVCSGLKTSLPTMFKTLTNITHTSDCPLPPANYSLKKWPSSTDFALPIPPGKYKATMMFVNNGKPVGCVHGEVDAIPRKKN